MKTQLGPCAFTGCPNQEDPRWGGYCDGHGVSTQEELIARQDEEMAALKKVMGSAVSTLLLSDHMGDAHEAGLTLVEALWGKAGREGYMEKVDSGDMPLAFRKLLSFYEPEVWRWTPEDEAALRESRE
jgi:hypothetical protein